MLAEVKVKDFLLRAVRGETDLSPLFLMILHKPAKRL